MYILVNVSRTYPKAQTFEERKSAVEGRWPINGVSSPDEFDASPAAQELLTFGHTLIGVAHNTIVDVRHIKGLTVHEDGRVTFDTDWPTDLGARLAGRRLSPKYAWRRGQGWPVQTIADEDLADISALYAPEGPDPVEKIDVGPYAVTLLANGNLRVHGPRTRAVSVCGDDATLLPGEGAAPASGEPADGANPTTELGPYRITRLENDDLRVQAPPAGIVTLTSR